MTANGVLQIAVFFGVVLACVKPLGAYMARVFEGQRTFLHPALRWLEVLTYRAAGIREDVEQRWTTYTASLLSFSIFGFLLAYLLQRAQGFLPFNPQHFNAGNVSPDSAFNTAPPRCPVSRSSRGSFRRTPHRASSWRSRRSTAATRSIATPSSRSSADSRCTRRRSRDTSPSEGRISSSTGSTTRFAPSLTR